MKRGIGRNRLVDAEPPLSMPAVMKSAESLSKEGQDATVRRNSCYLSLLALSAAASLIDVKVRHDTLELGAAVSVITLVMALSLQVHLFAHPSEQLWYRGRAAAESIKTTAWLFSVGGDPFPVSSATAEADFIERVRQLLHELRDLSLPVSQGVDQISQAMRTTRALSFSERKTFYLINRITDQLDWYGDKARLNGRRAKQWAAVATVATTLAVILGVLHALVLFNFDLIGPLTTFAAGANAWGQLRQHRTLAAAYSTTQQDLALVREEAHAVVNEHAWQQYVATAEEALSREHTLWLARRSKTTFALSTEEGTL